MDTATRTPSRRERYRAQTRAEIKQEARRQMVEAGGAGLLSLNAVARALGMAGPSLYGYFPSRDALLTELLVDAFGEFADALAGALRDGPAGRRDRVVHHCRAYRRWALEHPELYELLFGAPVPGYAAAEADTGDVAARSLLPLLDLIGAPRSSGGAAAPVAAPVPAWSARLADAGVDTPTYLAAVGGWARLHGLVSLELRGQLARMVVDPEALFEHEVEHLVDALLRPAGGA